jgi:hypothetical protein
MNTRRFEVYFENFKMKLKKCVFLIKMAHLLEMAITLNQLGINHEYNGFLKS